MKRFRLMQQVNPEGLYGTVQCALPHLKKAGAGRIVVVSPPIYSRFFRGKTAYAMGKVGMSVLTMGLAMDFERQGLEGMAVTSIWPAAVRTQCSSAEEGKKTDIETGDRVSCDGTVHGKEPGRAPRPAKRDHLLRRNPGDLESSCASGEWPAGVGRGFPAPSCWRTGLLEVFNSAWLDTAQNNACRSAGSECGRAE